MGAFQWNTMSSGRVKVFSEKNYEKLLTIDILCHGTPSNRMFIDYLNLLSERKNLKEITKVVFRDKSNGRYVYRIK